ncbi:MAG: hypothetical protein GX608_08805 [Lentisphaerae bacterium]|nr:hypothetical protein [Lentisphaerota bacterium]
MPAAFVAASLCDALRRRVQRDGYTEGFWGRQTIFHPVFFGGGGPPSSMWNASGVSSVARHGVARFVDYEGRNLAFLCSLNLDIGWGIDIEIAIGIGIERRRKQRVATTTSKGSMPIPIAIPIAI